MTQWPKDFTELVIDEVKKYGGEVKVKKAGLIERCMQRHCSPKMLHPNPDDEFSHEDIGPNFQIIDDYIRYIKKARVNDFEIFDEPVIVEKMESSGYLILNGHHRWFAALRIGQKKIHIQIVNLIHEADLSRMIEKNDNTKLVSFDLTEVLLAGDEDDKAEIVDSLFSRKIKKRLRRGAPEVIKALQKKGYDVWVYTSGYSSEEDIVDFFSMYEITVDGIINGVNEKRKTNSDKAKRVRNMMETKYNSTIHIDNDTVLCTHTKSKDFEQYDIFENSKDWAQGILGIIENK